jgi:hypothetical protein
MGFSYESLDSYILTGKAPEAQRKRIEAMKVASAHKCTTLPIPEF